MQTFERIALLSILKILGGLPGGIATFIVLLLAHAPHWARYSIPFVVWSIEGEISGLSER